MAKKLKYSRNKFPIFIFACFFIILISLIITTSLIRSKKISTTTNAYVPDSKRHEWAYCHGLYEVEINDFKNQAILKPPICDDGTILGKTDDHTNELDALDRWNIYKDLDMYHFKIFDEKSIKIYLTAYNDDPTPNHKFAFSLYKIIDKSSLSDIKLQAIFEINESVPQLLSDYYHKVLYLDNGEYFIAVDHFKNDYFGYYMSDMKYYVTWGYYPENLNSN